MAGCVNLKTEFAHRVVGIDRVNYDESGTLVVVESFSGRLIDVEGSGNLFQAKCPVTGLSCYFNRIGWYYGSLPENIGFLNGDY